MVVLWHFIVTRKNYSMKEVCLVTKDGVTRLAENSDEMEHPSAEWFVSYEDYIYLKKRIKELEEKLESATFNFDGA